MDKFNAAEWANRPACVNLLDKLIKGHPRFKGWELKETRPEDKTRYDFWLEKDGKKILIEHKARNYSKSAFNDWQVDGNKVSALRGLVKGDVVGVFYVNTFLDGAAIWNLNKLNIGTWRLSRPHYLKTVVESELTQTYDLFLRLDEAGYVE